MTALHKKNRLPGSYCFNSANAVLAAVMHGPSNAVLSLMAKRISIDSAIARIHAFTEADPTNEGLRRHLTTLMAVAQRHHDKIAKEEKQEEPTV
jgi:hypothetical protein